MFRVVLINREAISFQTKYMRENSNSVFFLMKCTDTDVPQPYL